MPQDAVPEVLLTRWLHSHEEDTADQMVFRPASFKFPRSRGRAGFELRPNQTLVEFGIGPTDRVEERPGSWKLEGKDALHFFEKSAPVPSRVMKIVTVDKDRLVIRKGQQT